MSQLKFNFRRILFLWFCFFLISVVSLYPEVPKSTTLSENDIEFEYLSIEDGLSQNTVNCILQDSKGFLWFGTEDGLNCFDGYKFTIFRPSFTESGSISHNYIWCIYEDHRGMLWIGTNGGGLNRFDPSRGNFLQFKFDPGNPDSISNNFIRSICEDREGCLWIGTEGGGLNKLILKDNQDLKRKFFHYKSEKNNTSNLSDNYIRAICEDHAGFIWIGTAKGLNKYDQESDRFFVYKHHPAKPDSLINDEVWSVYESREGHLWIGTSGGLSLFNRQKETFFNYVSNPHNSHGLSGNEIRLIFEDQTGLFWIGTNSDGVNTFDRKSGKFIQIKNNSNYPASLSSNEIRSITEDYSGILWIGTEGKGLNKYIPHKKKFFSIRKNLDPGSGLNNEMIWSVYEDLSGILWIGTNGGGLNKMDRSIGKTKYYTFNPGNPHSLSGNIVKSICEDQKGIIWIGTENGGLNKFDPGTERFIHFKHDPEKPSSLSSNFIRNVFEDKTGQLWVGTSGGGLNKFFQKTNKFKHYKYNTQDPGSISHDDVYCLFEDKEGILWIGTWGGGLNKFIRDKEQFVRYQNDPQNPKSLSHNLVLSIYEDEKGDFWIGTSGGGLNKFDRQNDTFSNYTKKNGLPNNVIYGILEDKQGNLWLSTNKGISRFNPRTEVFQNYTAGDGLQNNEFNGNSYHKSRRTSEFFFGGIEGVDCFIPEQIQLNEYIPPIVITSFLKFNRVVELPACISTLTELELSYKDYVFSFEFSALDYTEPEKNLFAYKLEGLDKDWILTDSKKRFATYTTLPSGTYIFKVKGSNSDGLWNSVGTSIKLNISPPFWASWWFKLLGLAFVLIVIVGFYKYRTYSIKKKARQLERINKTLQKQIKERQLVEEKLQKSEEKYRSLTENVSVGIFRTTSSPTGDFVEFNPALMRMFGFSSKEEMFKINVSDLYRIPDDRIKFNQKIREKGLVENEEFELRKKDGTPIWCSINAVAVYDQNKKIKYYDGIIEDITERKQLEARIRQTLKMEAIGKLAGGIAHDFNNILTVIHGHAELGLMRTKKNSSHFKDLNEILKSSKRANDLVYQLLAFSRKQIIKPTLVNVNQVLSDMDKMLRRLIREDIQINIYLFPDIPLIKADTSQLEQIFMNLIINARDSIYEKPEGISAKKIIIETSIAFLDKHFVNSHPGSSLGDHVVIAISDTGKGMTEKIKERIFEPFFTTKENKHSIGLGLSTVYGIVKQNNGSIYVYSEPNEGSIFRIYWPYAEDQKLPILLEKEIKEMPVGNETILIVEDNQEVRSFICDTLITFGYKVFEAENGIEALQLLKSKKMKSDLLITDVVMPEMGGKEVAEKVKTIFPKIKVLYTSGYTSNHIVHNGILDQGVNFIHKPFSIQVLLSKVREVLDTDSTE